jgi:hypothetical protein
MKSLSPDPSELLATYRKNQQEIYENGMFHGIYPRVTTNTALIEEQAKHHLSPKAFRYCKERRMNKFLSFGERE